MEQMLDAPEGYQLNPLLDWPKEAACFCGRSPLTVAECCSGVVVPFMRVQNAALVLREMAKGEEGLENIRKAWKRNVENMVPGEYHVQLLEGRYGGRISRLRPKGYGWHITGKEEGFMAFGRADDYAEAEEAVNLCWNAMLDTGKVKP